MLRKILFSTALAAMILSCNNQPASNEHDGHDLDHESTGAESGDGKHFGETISEDGAMPLEELLTKMNSTDSLNTKVIGTVDNVCQVKGCWMNLKTASGDKIFVQFKDYGFFMPKDIAGRQVVMDGYAYREVTSVEELRHYAEDEGKSKEEIEAITEPQEELKFLASGVVLKD